MMPCVTGWAASWSWITDANANPRQQKAMAPTTMVTASAGAVRAGTWAWKPAQPMTRSTTVEARATTTDVMARAAMSAAAGTGVARRRLRTPDSRWAVTEITRLMRAAAMIPRAMIPGT